MKKGKCLVIILVALAFICIGRTNTFASECEHSWTTDYLYNCCRCSHCGTLKPHNFANYEVGPADCTGQLITLKCLDCGAYSAVKAQNYAPHQWSETLWWDLDDTDHYIYGRYCLKCDVFERVPFTVKKGKTKQILPKRFLKGSTKRHLSYSKKKVQALKNGKVKGKKRGATATVKWDVRYRNHRGYVWWELYEADVIVK